MSVHERFQGITTPASWRIPTEQEAQKLVRDTLDDIDVTRDPAAAIGPSLEKLLNSMNGIEDIVVIIRSDRAPVDGDHAERMDYMRAVFVTYAMSKIHTRQRPPKYMLSTDVTLN